MSRSCRCSRVSPAAWACRINASAPGPPGRSRGSPPSPGQGEEQALALPVPDRLGRYPCPAGRLADPNTAGVPMGRQLNGPRTSPRPSGEHGDRVQLNAARCDRPRADPCRSSSAYAFPTVKRSCLSRIPRSSRSANRPPTPNVGRPAASASVNCLRAGSVGGSGAVLFWVLGLRARRRGGRRDRVAAGVGIESGCAVR